MPSQHRLHPHQHGGVAQFLHAAVPADVHAPHEQPSTNPTAPPCTYDNQDDSQLTVTSTLLQLETLTLTAPWCRSGVKELAREAAERT